MLINDKDDDPDEISPGQGLASVVSSSAPEEDQFVPDPARDKRWPTFPAKNVQFLLREK